jgi:tetratricopeptide (TPR) repeat protein
MWTLGRKSNMRILAIVTLCAAMSGWASASLFGISTQAVAAENASAVAWKDCQSTDENKRLVGCTSVINAQGFGNLSKLAEALDGRCWAYHVKKQFAQAIEDCKASIRIRPRYSYVYNNLGTAYAGIGNYEEAIKAFNTAIDLKPDFYWSRVKRAEALAAVGRNGSAAEDYEYLLKRDPTNQDLKSRLEALTVTSAPHADVTLADSAQTKCIVADPTGTPLNV